MSRVISYTSGITFIPTGYTNAGSYSFTSQTIANAYTNSDSTSNNRMTLARSNNSARKSEIYYEFDTSELENIPIIAVINSISCNVKYYVNSTEYVTEILMQLYSGNNPKGTAITNRPTTGTKYSINCGTWSLSELLNARLYISGTHNAGNRNAYLYFYGADLTVNYSVNGTAYEITASSDYTGATVSPLSQEVMDGESCTIRIDTNDINNIVVEDNGNDVTDQLQYVVPTGDSYAFTGIPVTYDSENSFYDSIYEGSTSDGLAPNTSTSRICAYVEQTAYAEAKLIYNFDCSSIPQNAIITSVTCIAAAACYSNGQYFDTRTLQLYNGNIAKGNATTITGNGNTRTDHNINGGTWTRSELNSIKIVIYIQRGNNTTQASVSFWGATLTVQYTLPEEPYYTYTINNIVADHTVIVSESIYIPPEEDPEIEYHSLTISSINATTTPKRGTTRVENGNSETITIYPDDPQITLILDNGVDVSSQLVAHGGTIENPVVSTAQGASYGFVYSSSTGYYISNNKGVDKSAAVCRVNFNLPVRCLITINYINYAEATYDFGVFGNIDSQLNTNYYAAGSGGASITDNDYKLACNTSTYNTSSVQTITYEIPSGEHYIDIKFSKDDATSSNNDTLQWKIASIEPLETNNYYTYTLNNINQDHSLVFIFGNVTYYFVTSSLNGNGKINPSGQMVVLPGDNYKLTIVPENLDDVVSITDNSIDVTNSIVKKQETIEKDGSTYTVVNYIYTLSNIQTGHTLNVFVQKNNSLFLKQNSNWITVYNVYIKNDNRWNAVDNFDTIFNDGTVYIKQ